MYCVFLLGSLDSNDSLVLDPSKHNDYYQYIIQDTVKLVTLHSVKCFKLPESVEYRIV